MPWTPSMGMSRAEYDRQSRRTFDHASGSQLVSYVEHNPDYKWPAYKLKEYRAQKKKSLDRANRNVRESERLDRKWNYGRESSDTYHARRRRDGLQKQVDGFVAQQRKIMNSYSSSPREKEAAQREIKRMTGRRY